MFIRADCIIFTAAFPPPPSHNSKVNHSFFVCFCRFLATRLLTWPRNIIFFVCCFVFCRFFLTPNWSQYTGFPLKNPMKKCVIAVPRLEIPGILNEP